MQKKPLAVVISNEHSEKNVHMPGNIRSRVLLKTATGCRTENFHKSFYNKHV